MRNLIPKKLTLMKARNAVAISGTQRAWTNRLIKQNTIVVKPSPKDNMLME